MEELGLLKLWLLLLVALFLAFLIEYRDRSLIQKKGKYDRLFTLVLIFVLGAFCGLRVWYNDTVTYLQMYDQTTYISDFFTSKDASIAGGWGFGFLNSIIKTLGFSSQDYLMLYAFLTVIPYVLFVRKYCPHFIFGVFLMFTTGFYSFTFAAIKQCMATGICLLAVMAALDRKWVRYFLLIGLAFLFHPYSIVYLIVPFMMFRPWTYRTYIYIFVFLIAGFALDSMLGTILDVTDLIGANYDAESFAGEGVNIFRVLVAFVPLVLSFPYKSILFVDSDKSENLMVNLAMVHALIMFVGLFGTANYFARLANYFLPAVVVVLPWMLNKLYYKHRPFLKFSCVAGYIGYFYYENAIRHPFDSGFSQISLWTYISSHFNG